MEKIFPPLNTLFRQHMHVTSYSLKHEIRHTNINIQSPLIGTLNSMVIIAQVPQCIVSFKSHQWKRAHNPKYLFSNIVKFYVHTFFSSYLLDVYTVFTPLQHVTESRLCAVLLEAPDNAQSHVIHIYMYILHCSCISVSSSSKQQCCDEMTLQYLNSL